MNQPLLSESTKFYTEECIKFMNKLIEFSSKYCGISQSKTINRVELKKGLLDVSKGRSLTNFIRTLPQVDKRHLYNITMMECPVLCPNKKMLLPPVESMPNNIMKSSKKLRNFFGIPELQVCRSCIKRSRCRRYQVIERDVPDLSDLMSLMIGLYTISKAHLNKNELVVPQFSLRDIQSATSIVDKLYYYFNKYITETEIPRGDDVECNKELRRIKRERDFKRLELLKAKIFNIPNDFNISPNSNVYMTKYQKELYKKLYKDNEKVEYIWVPDVSDTTLNNENKIDNLQIEVVDTTKKNNESSITVDNIEELNHTNVQFRMNYNKPIGSNYNITRFDIFNNQFLQGIKINHKGKITIDIDKYNTCDGSKLSYPSIVAESSFNNLPLMDGSTHRDRSDVPPTDLREAEGELNNEATQKTGNIRGKSYLLAVHGKEYEAEYMNENSSYVDMYGSISGSKYNYYSNFIEQSYIRQPKLSFLKTVPYNYKCQSSGDVMVKNDYSDMENLLDITDAIQAENNRR